MKFSPFLRYLSSALCLCSPTFAQWYIGGSVGSGKLYIKDYVHRINLDYPKKKKSFTHWGALGGVDIKSNNLYLSLEGELISNHLKSTLINDQTVSDEQFFLRHRYHWGAGVRFGAFIPLSSSVDMLLFGRMGFQVGKWTWKYQVVDAGINGGGYHKSASLHQFSSVPGMGAELTYKKHFSLRFDIRHVPSFAKNLVIGAIPPGSAPNFENSTLQSQIKNYSYVLISGVYKF